jgi:micrococcal nuclease
VGTAECFTGIVTRVVDGDTLDVGDIRIRLALVNTPERGEPGYSEATAFTKSLCPVGSTVLVDEDDGQRSGSYGRMVAKVFCEGKILNAELLYSGHAGMYTQYCSVSEFAGEPWAREYGC